MAEENENKAMLLGLGLDEKTAKQAASNKKLCAVVNEVVQEALIPQEGCSRAVGLYIYAVACKFPAAALVHRKFLLVRERDR